MRLRKVKHAPELLSSFPEYVVKDPENHPGRWVERFPNRYQSIHLEIGCGKGMFITRMAKRLPGVGFIAIEKFDSVLVRVLEKLISEPLQNLLLVHADAEAIPEMFAKGEITTLYLNFSDPWPKRRQAKKRLTNPRFLDKYAEILTDGGVIRFKTDNFGFFLYSLQSFNYHDSFKIVRHSLDLKNCDLDNVTTEFEERFSALGKPIFYLEVINRRSLS